MDLTELPPAAGQVAQPQWPPPVASTVRGAPAAGVVAHLIGTSGLEKRKHVGTHVIAVVSVA
jgi:hypothetical protein